jgi:phosphatidylglycerophosphate synthase
MPRLVIVGNCPTELWSMTAAERHRRAFARAGVALADSVADSHEAMLIAVRADYLLGQDLVAALATRPGTLLVTADGGEAVALHAHITSSLAQAALGGTTDDRSDALRAELDVLDAEALGSHYDNALRKRAKPVLMSYRTCTIDELERATFGAAYKGATDFVTKWLWPSPARWATRWAAARGITPNTVTTVSLLLVLLATWMFAQGYFLAAIPVAWAMTFLDTVDGKLARVTLTYSAWGNIYDHGIDLIHPPFWWWAWYVGALPLASPGIEPLLAPALLVVLGGYLVGRLLEGLFVLFFKIETHIWRPVDYFFRTITARRNPNLALLTIATVIGHPATGLVAVAVWTVVSLLFHLVRLIQAASSRARGHAVTSWLQA